MQIARDHQILPLFSSLSSYHKIIHSIYKEQQYNNSCILFYDRQVGTSPRTINLIELTSISTRPTREGQDNSGMINQKNAGKE